MHDGAIRVMRFDRAVLCITILSCSMSGCAMRVKRPGFEVWGLRYGRIEGEDLEWVMKAQAEGTLDNRELSCRVVKKENRLRFPLPGQFDRYGFTFEYATTKPDVPVELYVVYPDRYSPTTIGPIRQRGGQRSTLRGTAGRFCVSEYGTEPINVPGRYWYRLTVGGVRVKDWYVDLLNGDAALPEGSHTRAVLDEPELAPPPPLPPLTKGVVLPGR
jgi:hypothetical protein